MRCGVVLCCFVLCSRCATPSLAHVNTPVLDLAWGSGGRIHTRMHVYTPRMYIHMHIHACSHTLVYTCVGTHTCIHTREYTQPYTHASVYTACRYRQGDARGCMHKRFYAQAWLYAHAQAHGQAYVYTRNDCGCSKLVYTHSGSVQFSSVRLCTPDHAHVHSVAYATTTHSLRCCVST